MSPSPGPFESIESAQDFFGLLSDAVAEAKQGISSKLKAESTTSVSRRLDALRLALYNLEKLESHFHKSVRILNDLRSLRRLILEERGAAKVLAMPTQPTLRQDGLARRTSGMAWKPEESTSGGHK